MTKLTKTQVPNSHENGKEEGKEQHFLYALQLARSVTLPMVLNTAVKLKLLETIAGAGDGAKLSPAQIASQLSTRNPDAASMIDRMLLLLSSYSVVTCDVLEVAGGDDDEVARERFYGLSPVGKYFVADEEGGSVAPLLEMLQDKVLIDCWYELENAVVEGGIPFNRVHGTHTFEYMSRDPRFDKIFNKAMAGSTAKMMKILLDEYKGFEHLQTLVDVGGGIGMTLHKITSKYPSIQGVNFDLPHVIQNAPSFPGVKHIGGNMFDSVPSGDAIIMKKVLHDWTNDHCIKLLKNCYKALPYNGMVIVVDMLLPTKPDTSTFSKDMYQTDILMLTCAAGGKERSESELRALALAAGFKGIRLNCCVGDFTVVEIYK